MKKHTLLIAFLICIATQAHSQHYYQKNKKGGTHVGLLFEGAFSGLDPSGFTPSLTIGNDCHELQIGPRFQFSKIKGDTPIFNFMMDFGYRVNYMHKPKVSMYGIFRTVYATQKDEITVDEVRHEVKKHNTNFFLGTGAEFRIMDNVYLKLEGLLGNRFKSGQQYMYNYDTEESSIAPYIFKNDGFTWLASFGLGYRF